MDDHYLPIDGFPGYRVSRLGEIQSRWLKAGRHSKLTEEWRPLKPFLRCGYPSVNLSRAGEKSAFKAHRLVLGAFVGPCPEGMVACHKDGNRENGTLSNLRWDTHKSNSNDTLLHGRRSRGANVNSKLVEQDVLEIRRRWAEGTALNELAAEHGVTKGNIRAIVQWHSWRHLPQGDVGEVHALQAADPLFEPCPGEAA